MIKVAPIALAAAAAGLLPALAFGLPKRHRARPPASSAPSPVLPAAVSAFPPPPVTAAAQPRPAANAGTSAPSPGLSGAAAPAASAPVPPGSVVVSVVNVNRRTAPRDTVTKRSRWLDPMRPAVVGELGPEIGIRDFRYGQPVSAGLRSYSNPAIVMGQVRLEAYPLAPMSTPILRDVGVTGTFGTSLPIDSASAGGASIGASWTRYEFGARLRVRLSDPPRAPWLFLDATYGDSKFNFTGSDPLAADAPSVEYKYGRAGADARVPFGKWSLLAGAGYRYIWSSGLLGQRFPRSTTGGVDVHVGAAYRINMYFEARASAEYQAVLTNMNAQPGDRFIAGQALDQYAVLHVGVTALVF
jgi:hypothetical protein